MNKRLRTLLLVALLLIVALALSGCMTPTTGPVDLNNPVGLWNTIVYALAKVLIAINDFIANLGIPYSWGWAIIIFTIAIKLVTLPLTFKQLQSAKAQQVMQPKLRELQEKYGKDKQKLSEEQMKLYKEAGINPLGGCLPLLIQMPILFALYQALYVLAGSGHLKNAPFFFIPDLSLPGSTAATAGVIDGIPMIGTTWITTAFKEQNWYVLFAYMSLPIFMLLTQMLLQKMSHAGQGPEDRQGGRADANDGPDDVPHARHVLLDHPGPARGPDALLVGVQRVGHGPAVLRDGLGIAAGLVQVSEKAPTCDSGDNRLLYAGADGYACNDGPG